MTSTTTLGSLLGRSLSWRIRGIVVRLSLGWVAMVPLLLLVLDNLFAVGLRLSRLDALGFAVIALVFLQLSLLLHEIGHALAAREVGNPAHMIELTSAGGATATGGEGATPGSSARRWRPGSGVNHGRTQAPR